MSYLHALAKPRAYCLPLHCLPRSGQGGLLIAIIMAFFVLTSQTLYITLGRYDLYLREFAAIYLLFLVELLLYIGSKAYATVRLPAGCPAR